MSVHFPHDCLAYHLTRPLLRAQSLENVPRSKVAELIAKFRQSNKAGASPENEALQFYQLCNRPVTVALLEIGGAAKL